MHILITSHAHCDYSNDRSLHLGFLTMWTYACVVCIACQIHSTLTSFEYSVLFLLIRLPLFCSSHGCQHEQSASHGNGAWHVAGAQVLFRQESDGMHISPYFSFSSCTSIIAFSTRVWQIGMAWPSETQGFGLRISGSGIHTMDVENRTLDFEYRFYTIIVWT